MKTPFAAVHESGFGTFRTCQTRQPMSGFRGKAAVPQKSRAAEFDPIRTSAKRGAHVGITGQPLE
jgi:hypothetical protein